MLKKYLYFDYIPISLSNSQFAWGYNDKKKSKRIKL